MFTVVISVTFSRRLLRQESIYTLKLSRGGIHLHGGRDVDVLQSVTVGEIMQPQPVTVAQDMPLTELSEVFSRYRRRGFPVLTADTDLWGIATVEDLDRAVSHNMSRQSPVSAFGTPRDRLTVTYPEETMGAALARLSARGLGHLPVVDRARPTRLLGLIRREDIIRAYSVALARRAELQHRAKRMQLRDIDGTEFVEVVLSPGDRGVGTPVQEIAKELPSDCILVSIRRDGRLVIPHGDTLLKAGDRITAFAQSRRVEAPHGEDSDGGVDGTRPTGADPAGRDPRWPASRRPQRLPCGARISVAAWEANLALCRQGDQMSRTSGDGGPAMVPKRAAKLAFTTQSRGPRLAAIPCASFRG